MTATSSDEKVKAKGKFVQAVELAYGPNNTSYHSFEVDKLAVAVVDAVPFNLHIVQPKVAAQPERLDGAEGRRRAQGRLQGADHAQDALRPARRQRRRTVDHPAGQERDA